MSKIVRRGYIPTDEREFREETFSTLYKAGSNLYYLLNEGYPVKSASTFVGNHYLLSERQRLALVRAIASHDNILLRNQKEVTGCLADQTVHIDGFNTIITLEVALSKSLLLKCMDGTVRDLAGLRGTYRLIDKTDVAIRWIGDMLEKHKVQRAHFYLDAPVSNSGKLGQRIREVLAASRFEVEVAIINDVDSTLEIEDNVVTSDAIILNHCNSWINLCRQIIDEKIGQYPYVDFSSVGTP